MKGKVLVIPESQQRKFVYADDVDLAAQHLSHQKLHFVVARIPKRLF